MFSRLRSTVADLIQEAQIWEWTAHLFFPSVLTVIRGAPRREGPRNSELGPLIVSVDFQLSVLELVAELLRTAPSFLVMVDQQCWLRGGHKSLVCVCEWVCVCGCVWGAVMGSQFGGEVKTGSRESRVRGEWRVESGEWRVVRLGDGCHGRLHGCGLR